jgi:membrane protein YdbS with pleckstrin-like domain
MTFPARLLAPGEEVYLDSRPHWSLLFWPSVVTVVVLAGCIAVVVLWPSAPIWMAWVLLGFGLAALVNLLARYLSWTTKSFVVTSQRIVYRTGIIRRTGREIPIGRVQDVTYHQTVVERIVRAGSLTVESAGRQGQDPFPDIRRPDEVQSLINRVVGQLSGGYPVAQGPGPMTPASAPPASPTPVAAIPFPSSPPPEAPTYPVPPPMPLPRTFPATPPITDPTPPVAPQPAVARQPTIAQQLVELADLHKHGVITDAEYEHKRQEFLDRL